MTPTLSIIVPMLNEGEGIAPALAALATMRQRGVEVIAVDGGSSDGSIERAKPFADRVLSAPRGRSRQMNAGAAIARGHVFLFLHADTRLPLNADRLVLFAVDRSPIAWGRFDLQIDGRSWLLKVVATMINWRSALTRIATGDQAMFATRDAFEKAGGFPDLPLMEDVALSRALKRLKKPYCLAAPVITSARRWEKHGVLRTVLLMWRLRLEFFLGANPARLARRYGYAGYDN